MEITVHVQWESGRPCSGVVVAIRLDGGGQGEAATDLDGNAGFALDPSAGTVLCDGQEVRRGALAERVTVTCRENVLFTWA
jgi:hypothetical protein